MGWIPRETWCRRDTYALSDIPDSSYEPSGGASRRIGHRLVAATVVVAAATTTIGIVVPALLPASAHHSSGPGTVPTVPGCGVMTTTRSAR